MTRRCWITARARRSRHRTEDSGAPSGTVGTLVSNLVDFASPAGQLDNVSELDSGALLGIAVMAADTTNGTWYFSTNNGSSWNALGTVADNNARLLAADANTRLYFQPNADYYGTLATAITFRAWDQASGSNGTLADTTSNGGTTAFSTATDTASLVINPVADTPSVTNATTNEDTQTTSGLVISRHVADAMEVTHFKITGISNGTLYKNDGTTQISNGAFIIFAEGNAGLKFTPTADFSGNGSFTVQASMSNGDAGLGGGTVIATITVNAVNDAPVITSNGGGATANVSISENLTAVTTVSSTDIDGGTPSYSLAGGADVALFSIDSSTGALSFLAAPNREAPSDADVDNLYEITVQVSDGNGGIDTQAITVTVNDVDEFDVTAPSDSDGSANAVNENAANGTTVGITASASDADATTNTITYSLTDDAGGRFTIDANSGVVTVANGTLLDREAAASPQHHGPRDLGRRFHGQHELHDQPERRR